MGDLSGYIPIAIVDPWFEAKLQYGQSAHFPLPIGEIRASYAAQLEIPVSQILVKVSQKDRSKRVVYRQEMVEL